MRPTREQVLTALLPIWDDAIDPRSGRLTGGRIMLASSYGSDYLIKALPEFDAAEVIEVAEELVTAGRISAYDTYLVGRVSGGHGRVYFYRDYRDHPPEEP